MEETNRIVRRMHTPELKRAVLDKCSAGASVASVAMAFGINTNLVHKWRRSAQRSVVATWSAATPVMAAPAFIRKPSINHALARGAGTDMRRAVYGPSAMFQCSSAS